nr:PREDICTED: protein POF1B isoform X2 [Lepisosteus oculatus]
MSLPVSPGASSYRTVSFSSSSLSPMSPELPVSGVPVSGLQMTGVPVQYVTNGAGMEGNVVYETVRYLVPVERKVMPESYWLVDNRQQLMATPTYVQRYSVSSADGLDTVYQQQHVQQQSTIHLDDMAASNGKTPSVFSQTSSPAKSPEPSSSETVLSETVERSSVVKTEARVVSSQAAEQPKQNKLDNRFFGELLAEVYRKNSDIYSCIADHVGKIRGQKHHLDNTIDYKAEKEQVEGLIPKDASELTKQQIRYLLETRMTADKTLRLLLSTFSSLREELMHLQQDLQRLEMDKESLESDLSFKADQAQQYDRLLESVRENNRQLQLSLKESAMVQRSLESQLLTTKHTESDRDYRLKELECSKKALEQENEILRQKLSGQCTSPSFQAKSEEISRYHMEMISSLREEKDKELEALRTQLNRIQTEFSSKSSSDHSLQLRITELMSSLEQKESLIKKQEEELRRLQNERNEALSQSKNSVTKTIITKKYRNQYPILGLLSDDYQATSPVKEAKTIVIERTGEMYKQVRPPSPVQPKGTL